MIHFDRQALSQSRPTDFRVGSDSNVWLSAFALNDSGYGNVARNRDTRRQRQTYTQCLGHICS